MSVLEYLASSLDRKDQTPNIELAERIVESDDASAVSDLVEGLLTGTRPIRNDCIKVLYEIGERRPELIADHFAAFLSLLDHSDNRLNWGGMAALDAIALHCPEDVAQSLSRIVRAAEAGSVITRDGAVGVLIKLSGLERYRAAAFPFLIEFIRTAPANQLPMYAERAWPVVEPAERDLFVRTLESRLDDIDKESKRKRVEKVIRTAERGAG